MLTIKVYHTENQYYNEKLHKFMEQFDNQRDRSTVAKIMSFILNNYPETHLFLRGEKVAEDSKQIGEF